MDFMWRLFHNATAYFLQGCTITHYLRCIVLIDFLDTYKAAKEYTNFTTKSV